MTRSGDNPNTLVNVTSGKAKRTITVDAASGNPNGIQYPMCVDGDSVYAKDIWVDESNINTFSGGVLIDLFNNLHSVVSDSTSNDPKELFIHFNRTTIISAIALGAFSGDFSNVKISVLVSGGLESTVIDESADNTKYTSRQWQLQAVGFNAIRIQFHTVDTVTLSNIFMLKAIAGVSRISIQKPDDTFVEAQGTQQGNFKMSVEEIEPETIANFDTDLAIARGLVPGIVSDDKFGRGSIQQSNTDVWDRADATPTQQIWLPPTQARIHAIVSTLDADSDVGGSVAQGNGGRTIEIFGLTDWDSSESSEIVVLDGTTPVNTISSYVIIHRMIMKSWGSGGSPNAGIITATAATDGTVTAQINAAKGQTNMAIWGIPSTQTAYIKKYYLSVHEAASPSSPVEVDVTMLVNPIPKTELLGYIDKFPNGATNTGSSSVPHEFSGYIKIPGPAIIKMQCLASADDTDASAGFGYKLIDN